MTTRSPRYYKYKQKQQNSKIVSLGISSSKKAEDIPFGPSGDHRRCSEANKEVGGQQA